MKKSKVCLIIVLIVLILIAIAGVVFYLYENSKLTALNISLIGDSDITLNLNDEYLEPGITAIYGKNNVSNSVITNSTLDNTKIGTYDIVYSINYKRKSTSITRKVNIVDTIAPEITLKGESEVSLYINGKYEELGYTAIDNYDGDITDKVTIDNQVDLTKAGDYKIIYSITDTSGNTSTKERTVKVKNKTTYSGSGVGIPVLMYHFFYDSKVGEPGPDANFMEISDFEQQVKYLVENEYYFPNWDEMIAYVNGTGTLPAKSIVLTIDDGSETFFRLAVPVLQKYNIPATSFVITSSIGASGGLDQYRNIINFESHSHGMHRAGTNGKGKILTLSHDDAISDLKKSQEICESSLVFCYPFGHYNDYAKSLLKEAGFKLAFTTEYGKVRRGMDPYQLPRIRMSKGTSLASFINKIK